MLYIPPPKPFVNGKQQQNQTQIHKRMNFLVIAANSSNDEWKLIGKITRNH